MRIQRLSIVLLVVLVLGFATIAQASDFPNRPITLGHSYSAGGGTDVLARQMAVYLEKYLGAPVVVQPMPGAGGQVGWTYAADVEPDGYTIWFVNMPAINAVWAVRDDVAFHPADSWDAIGCNVIDPNIITVANDHPIQSLEEWIEKAKANPYELIIAADGPYSDDHVAVMLMEEELGIQHTFIPYHGAAPANAALLAGEGDANVENVGSVYLPFQDEKRALAVMHWERYYMIPDVPTFEEITGIPLYHGSTRGLVAPKGVPAERLEILREAFAKMAADEDFIRQCEESLLTLVDPMVGDEFGDYIQRQQAAIEDILDLLLAYE